MLEPVRASFRDDKPLDWIRVHDLPDFVYFNHSIHVKQGRRLRDLPRPRRQDAADASQAKSLQMEWCLDCHRDPEKYLRPRERGLQHGIRAAGDQIGARPAAREGIQDREHEHLTSCSTCHR